MHAQPPWTYYHEGHGRIDGVVGTVCHFHSDPEQQPSLDDGILMAAAPELLAALAHVLAAHLNNGEFDNNDWVLKLRYEARAAIAKATR